VLGVIEIEKPEGVIVQFGGQTPLKLARGLVDAGVPLLGTPVDSIDLAEDRPSFGGLMKELGLKSPPYATARDEEGALQAAEEAGIHSGDSACVIPALSLGPEMLAQIEEATQKLALSLGVIGLINIQYAVHGDEELYVIEANPRASRTVPFVSKAVGVPLAKMACRLMLGEKLRDMDLPLPARPDHVSVKEAVLPFSRFPRADALLGPEMKSTGEVMGVAADYPTAFGKAQAAAGAELPTTGKVFITVTDGDKPAATQLAASLHDLGFDIVATGGTARAIKGMNVPVERIKKISEGSPNVVNLIESGEVTLVINTPTGSGARSDGFEIRRAAIARGIPCITTMSAASAAQRAIRAKQRGDGEVRSLQELHAAEPSRVRS